MSISKRAICSFQIFLLKNYRQAARRIIAAAAAVVEG